MRIDINVEGADSIIARLEGFADDVIPAISKGVQEGLRLIQDDAVMNVPYASNELKKSIITRMTEESSTVVAGEVHVGAEHGVYVEYGTGAVGAASDNGKGPLPAGAYSTGMRTIEYVRKDGKPVRFVTDGWVYPVEGGGFRFTRGQPARPFMYPAYVRYKKQVPKMIRKAIEEAMP